MKALIVLALMNFLLFLAYLFLYVWHSLRRVLSRFRSVFG